MTTSWSSHSRCRCRIRRCGWRAGPPPVACPPRATPPGGGATSAPPEHDDAPLLGTPAEIVARLAKLQAGGVENVLLVDPAANVESLRTFASEIMPAVADTRNASPLGS